jgi:predicted alternative tryptophan synthase beta-subunit
MPHIYLKREDLNHTGAHKINNSLGMRFSACEWARSESSLRRAQVSMESQRRPCA